jgi:hypothetical protein
MRQLMIAALLYASAAVAATEAAAQGVYKYTDKNGHVVYTDDPKAGGGAAQPVEDKTSAVSVPAPANSEATRRLLEQADKRAAALDRATSDIAAAQIALNEAVARQEAGVEPIEGERQGRRFRPEYWKRQQKLQNDVATSRARLEEALARRNALR